MATGRAVLRVVQWAVLAMLATVALVAMIAAVVDDSDVPPSDPTAPAETTTTSSAPDDVATDPDGSAPPSVEDVAVLPQLGCAVLGRNVFGDVALRVYVSELSEATPSALDVEMELRHADGTVVGVTSEPITGLPAAGTVTHDAETVIDAPEDLDTVSCIVTAVETRAAE